MLSLQTTQSIAVALARQVKAPSLPPLYLREVGRQRRQRCTALHDAQDQRLGGRQEDLQPRNRTQQALVNKHHWRPGLQHGQAVSNAASKNSGLAWL